MKTNHGIFLWAVSAAVLVTGGQACRAGENDTYLPFNEDGLQAMEKSMFREIEPAVLAQMEADARKRLESGGIPPAWRNLVPKLTREECAKMSTAELAEACFASGYLTRRQLAANRPGSAFVDVKVWFPCYGELFEREDLWKGILKAYSVYASRLDPKGDPNSVMDGALGFGTLRDLFQMPRLQEQMRGKELLFVRAQLDALKQIRSYMDSAPGVAQRSSTSFFMGVPTSLLQHGLVFMHRGAPGSSAPVIARICKIPLSRKPTMGQLKAYVDAVTPEIEQFLKETAPPAR